MSDYLRSINSPPSPHYVRITSPPITPPNTPVSKPALSHNQQNENETKNFSPRSTTSTVYSKSVISIKSSDDIFKSRSSFNSQNSDSNLSFFSTISLSELTDCTTHFIDSGWANLLGGLTGFIELVKSLESTTPDLFSRKSEYLISNWIGTSCYLFTGAVSTFAICHKNPQFNIQSSKIFTNFKKFFNEFNFSYDTTCRLIGEFLSSDYPDALECIPILACFFYAASCACGTSFNNSQNVIYKLLRTLSSTFTAGVLVGNFCKIIKFINENYNEKNTTNYILCSQFIAFIIMAIVELGNCIEIKNISLYKQRGAFINNLLSQVVLFISSQNLEDDSIRLPSFLLLTCIFTSGIINVAWPTFLSPFQRTTSSTVINTQLLEN